MSLKTDTVESQHTVQKQRSDTSDLLCYCFSLKVCGSTPPNSSVKTWPSWVECSVVGPFGRWLSLESFTCSSETQCPYCKESLLPLVPCARVARRPMLWAIGPQGLEMLQGLWPLTSQPPQLWTTHFCCLFIAQSKVVCKAGMGLNHDITES